MNRTLNGQKDSEKEEHSWRHLPIPLQTTSRSCSDHHSEELAGTQTHGLQERIESPETNPPVHGQFLKIKPGTSEEERTVFSRNSDRKMATYTEEHQCSSSTSSNANLTENPPLCTRSSFPESSEMDLQSALSWTQETSTPSSFFALAAPPCWWALRQPCSSQPGCSPVIQKPEP